ncbi:hypothetical protein V6N13_138861 [Hibiscus sabdariffa]|uniref:Uncharacterized protein n=1 Tax=Hibiscus sabdariffa TaxID=183260 RepID=A0ABR2PK25_9ROSI
MQDRTSGTGKYSKTNEGLLETLPIRCYEPSHSRENEVLTMFSLILYQFIIRDVNDGADENEALTTSMSISDGGTPVYTTRVLNMVSSISESVSLRPKETLLYHKEHSLDNKFLHQNLNWKWSSKETCIALCQYSCSSTQLSDRYQS